MPEKPLTPAQILTILSESPRRIAAVTAGLEPALLRAAPNPGDWSANEVLAHLRACADVWGGCIATILAQDHPTIRAVNPRTWITSTDYLEQEFAPSLRAYSEQRAGLLAVLGPLTPARWSRGATVTGAGNVLERTVQFYAEWMARHERPHVRQIERIVSTLRQRH